MINQLMRIDRIQKFNFLFICIFCFSFSSYSQNSKTLKGEIVSRNPAVEKIHVINLTNETGAVTNAEGKFSIMAAENDSIYVSSVQFENKFVVITSDMIRKGILNIELIDEMNELAEVMIDDIQLSGYLANDINMIAVEDVVVKNRLQQNLDDFIKKDKEMNPYYEPSIAEGIRIDKIARAVIDKLSKPSAQPKAYSPKELVNKSISIVGYEFFKENLELTENEVFNFLFFCTEDLQFKRLVVNNNSFVLIEYFESRIEAFHDLRGRNLNVKREIPG